MTQLTNFKIWARNGDRSVAEGSLPATPYIEVKIMDSIKMEIELNRLGFLSGRFWADDDVTTDLFQRDRVFRVTKSDSTTGQNGTMVKDFVIRASKANPLFAQEYSIYAEDLNFELKERIIPSRAARKGDVDGGTAEAWEVVEDIVVTDLGLNLGKVSTFIYKESGTDHGGGVDVNAIYKWKNAFNGISDLASRVDSYFWVDGWDGTGDRTNPANHDPSSAHVYVHFVNPYETEIGAPASIFDVSAPSGDRLLDIDEMRGPGISDDTQNKVGKITVVGSAINGEPVTGSAGTGTPERTVFNPSIKTASEATSVAQRLFLTESDPHRKKERGVGIVHNPTVFEPGTFDANLGDKIELQKDGSGELTGVFWGFSYQQQPERLMIHVNRNQKILYQDLYSIVDLANAIMTTNGDNLGDHVATTHLVPDADITWDLGTPTERWRNVYAQNFIGTFSPTGFTEGSVIFVDSSGALAEDNAQFFWHDAQNVLAIGATATAFDYQATPIYKGLIYADTVIDNTASQMTAGVTTFPTLRYNTSSSTGANTATFAYAIQPATGTTKSGANDSVVIQSVLGGTGYGGTIGTESNLRLIAVFNEAHTNFHYGIRIDTPAFQNSGTVGENIGIRIRNQSVAGVTTPWGIYQEGTSTPNHFDGRVETSTSFRSLNLTEGSIPFLDSNKDFVEDNTNLFWNNTDKRLIVGDKTKTMVISGFDVKPSYLSVVDSLRYNYVGLGYSFRPTVALGMARGTKASPLIVQSGDGPQFAFLGYDGVDFQQMALITASVDGTPGSDDMPGRLTFHTTPDGSTIPAEAMRIDSIRNVRIGSSVSLTSRLNFDAATTAAGGINFGGDVALFRGATSRLDLASGDSLRLATDGSSGTLQLGSAGDYSVYRGAANSAYSVGHWVPSADSTYDLGTTSLRWRFLYVDDADFTNDVAIGGTLDMTSGRIINLATPVDGTDAVNKDYVDSFSQGLDWQESVIDQDLTAPPGTPNTGDRYIIAGQGGTATGAWAGEEEKITEWDGAQWLFFTPDEGTAVWVEDEDVLYVYNNTHPTGAWVKFGSTIDHGNLLGLGDDDHTQYVHVSNARTISAVHDFTTGITASFLTQGSVVFAGTGGAISEDNSNLFWDDSNNRLGVGTSSPGSRLDVLQSADSSVGGLRVRNGTGTIALWHGSGNAIIETTGATALELRTDATTNDGQLYLDTNGRIGINEQSPDNRFHVTHNAASAFTAKFENPDAAGLGILVQAGDGTGTDALALFETSAGSDRFLFTHAGQLRIPQTGSTSGLLLGGVWSIYDTSGDNLAFDRNGSPRATFIDNAQFSFAKANAGDGGAYERRWFQSSGGGETWELCTIGDAVTAGANGYLDLWLHRDFDQGQAGTIGNLHVVVSIRATGVGGATDVVDAHFERYGDDPATDIVYVDVRDNTDGTATIYLVAEDFSRFFVELRATDEYVFSGASGATITGTAVLNTSTDAPNLKRHGPVDLGNFTAGSVLFAGTGGVITEDNANFFWDDATNQLRLAATGSSAGILIGGDTQLYRSAANTLLVPDLFRVQTALGGPLIIATESGPSYSNSNAAIRAQTDNTNPVSNSGYDLLVTGDTAARWLVRFDGLIAWGTGSGSVDTNLYRSAANILATDDQFRSIVGASNTAISAATTAESNVRWFVRGDGVFFWSDGAGANDIELRRQGANLLQLASGDTLRLATDGSSGGLQLGSSGDVNLYLDAADRLKTDDAMQIGGNLGIGTTPASSIRLSADSGSATRPFNIFGTNHGFFKAQFSSSGGGNTWLLGTVGSGSGTNDGYADITLYRHFDYGETIVGNTHLVIGTRSTTVTAQYEAFGTATTAAGDRVYFDVRKNGSDQAEVYIVAEDFSLFSVVVHTHHGFTFDGSGGATPTGTAVLNTNTDQPNLPRHGPVDLGAFTEGSVLFADSAGAIAEDNTNFFWDDTGNQLRLAATGSGAGILLGGDAQWYRSTTNTLRTPDSVIVDVRLASGVTVFTGQEKFTAGINTSPTTGAGAITVGSDFVTGSSTVTGQTGDVIYTRIRTATLTAPVATTVPNSASLKVDGAPVAAASATITNSYALWVDDGTTRLDGTLDVRGNVILGDADTDTVDVNAEFISHLIPDVTSTYDLGSASKRWNTLYIDSIDIAGGGVAPDDAQYLVLVADGTLTDERVFTPGTHLAITDGGPGSAYDIDVDEAANFAWTGNHTIATISGGSW